MRIALPPFAVFVFAISAGVAFSAADPKTEMTVRLPPFIVETPRGPAWRYLEIPHYEILSRCDRLATQDLALAFHRANQLLNLVLPSRFQLAFDAPQTLIFYDEALWPAAEREAVRVMLSGPGDSTPSGLRLPNLKLPANAPQPGKVGIEREASDIFFSNVMLSDADSNTTFVLVSAQSIDPLTTFLTPSTVNILLRGRIPALPEWFTTTFLRLYRRMEFRDHRIVLPLSLSALKLQPANGRTSHQLDLLPWSAFFNPAAPEAEQSSSRWLEQAELFVTWGMDPATGKTDAFWTFLDRACHEPVTKEMFRECFGADFADVSQQLSDYSFKTGKAQWILPERLAKLPARELRDALPEEVARIMGEWERLETRYVAVNQPDLQLRYQELARHTLLKSYDRGDRDPRLVASLGLLELEAGNQALAREYLEAIATEPALRPRACFELAQLRYHHEFGRSPRNDGKFMPEQTATIAAPLLLAIRRAPPLPQVYELLANVYENSVEPASPEVVAALAEGRRLFPPDTAPKRWQIFSYPPPSPAR